MHQGLISSSTTKSPTSRLHLCSFRHPGRDTSPLDLVLWPDKPQKRYQVCTMPYRKERHLSESAQAHQGREMNPFQLHQAGALTLRLQAALFKSHGVLYEVPAAPNRCTHHYRLQAVLFKPHGMFHEVPATKIASRSLQAAWSAL
ncbi:hypothetical protein ISCGN_025137 [Ixodes scapularis]